MPSPEPQYARVFEIRGVLATFPATEQGAIKMLDGEYDRERFFDLTNGLVPEAVDLGTRLLCTCGDPLGRHVSGPLRAVGQPGACTNPNCPCTSWEPSDCACHVALGARVWCHACVVRWSYFNGEPYDDSLEATLTVAQRAALANEAE